METFVRKRDSERLFTTAKTNSALRTKDHNEHAFNAWLSEHTVGVNDGIFMLGLGDRPAVSAPIVTSNSMDSSDTTDPVMESLSHTKAAVLAEPFGSIPAPAS